MLTTFFREEHEIFRKTLRDWVAQGARALRRTSGRRPSCSRARSSRRRASWASSAPATPRTWAARGGDWWYTAVWGEELVRSGCAGVNMALAVQSTWPRRSSTSSARASRRTSSSRPRCAATRSRRSASASPTAAPTSPSHPHHRARRSATTTSSTAPSAGSPTARAPTSSRSRCAPAAEGYGGISLVLFPTDVKGFKVARKIHKAGNHASDTAELVLRGLPHPRALPPRRGEPRLLLHHDQLPGRAADRRRQGRSPARSGRSTTPSATRRSARRSAARS